MKKNSRSFHLNIKFPENAYIAYFLIMQKRGINFFYPFNEIFVTVEEIKRFSRKFLLQNTGESASIPPAPIVFPITFAEKISLKPQYWNDPDEELGKSERINNFLKPLHDHRSQKLLAVPVRKGDQTRLKAAYCFNLNALQAEISFFLSNTYLSMDPRVKYPAVYRFQSPFRFELESGKKIKIQESSSNLVFN